MLRVAIVDDDPMVRRLVDNILSSAGIEIVGHASDGDEAVGLVRSHRPDVLLMDIRMERVDGIRATSAVLALPDPPAVIVMTSFDTEAAVLDAVQAGAAGFLAKDAGPDEIISAVRSVGDGDSALSPRAARVMVERVAADASLGARRDARRRVSALSPRETEIARLVAAGHSNGEIARSTYLSEATVKSHLQHAMIKTATANRVQLAVLIDRASDHEIDDEM